MRPERVPSLVGVATLAAGIALVAAPQLTTRVLGLEGEEAAFRALGAADLVLVPGLLAGRPRWPWMAARATLTLAQAGWLAAAAGRGVAPRRSPYAGSAPACSV